MKKFILILLIVLFSSLAIFGDDLKDTPAFVKLNLHRIKIETELTDLKTKYLERHPEVVAKNTELQVTKHALEQLLLYKQIPLDKFGNNMAELLIKKILTETALLNLKRITTETHPDFIAKSSELKIITKEIETILPPLVQTNNEQKKEEQPKFQVKLFEIKYKQPQTLVNAINALGSGLPNARIDANNDLKTITVRDFPENIAAIEGALKRLDLPDAAPVSIQTQIYLIAASDEAAEPGTIPKEIDSVMAQVKATLKYKNYRFLNTYINRVNDGGGIEYNGKGDFKTIDSGNNPSFLNYNMRSVRLATDNTGKEAIRIGRFYIGGRIPVQSGLPPNVQYQYQDVGLTTELSLPEGGLVVVGTTNLGTSGGAIIVVVSAKRIQ